MQVRVLLLAGFLGSPSAVAQPWSLASCGPQGEPGWKQFEHAVRTAAPGSTIYVPKPYPKSDRDVVEDFLYHYRDSYSRGFDQERLREAIASQSVSYTVLRMENWTTLRCSPNRKQDFYYMVRTVDAGSGAELARAVLDDSGLMVALESFNQLPKASDRLARRKILLPEAHDALQEIATRFRIAGDSPEYVMSFGTVACSFTRPCLAFRHGGNTYIYSRVSDELFRISPGGRRLTQGRDVGSLETNSRLQKELAEDERFVSLGGDSWAVTTKVPAPP